jgi:mannose-6-phosphate isomerase
MANSEAQLLSPFRIEPRFVSRVWGSPDLRPWYDHQTQTGSGDPIGEVWLTGDSCRVLDGELAGKTLAEAFALQPLAMLGLDAPNAASPLLLKVLFAKEKLSVQVHPNDALAQKYGEPRGKTECWYALAAEPGAQVAVGLRHGVSLNQVEREVNEGTLEESLNVVSVSAGEMIYVDAGTVHAIWPGSVLLETQQNCDLTYRLFDYGRPRELHVAKALEAMRLETAAGSVTPVSLSDRIVLVDRAYFCVERMTLREVKPGDSMRDRDESPAGLAYLFAAAGSGRVVAATAGPDTLTQASNSFSIDLPERGVVAVPAMSPAWQLEPGPKGLELIRITPRWPVTAAMADPEAAA